MANNDKPQPPQDTSREAKLAKALRDNLRRRKAAARDLAGAKTPPKPQGD